MSTKDFLEKDYYATSASPRTPRPTRSRRPTASSPGSTTRRQPGRRPGQGRGALQGDLRGLRRARPTTTRRKEYDEARSLFGSGGPAGSGPGAAAPAARAAASRSTSATSSAAAARRGPAGSATCSAVCSASAPRRPHGRSAPRCRRRVVGHPAVRRGGRRRHRPAAADAASGRARPATAPGPRPARCRAPARPARAPARRQPQPGRLRLRRAVPRLPRPRARRRRPVPDCDGHRPGHGHPHAHGAHPGRREGRPADPAQGQGRCPASGAGRPATSTSPCRSSTAPAVRPQGDNLTLTVPVTFPEAALGGEIKVPTLPGRRSPCRSRRAPPTAAPSGSRARVCLARTAPRADLLVTVEVAVPQALDAAREAVEKFRDATAGDDPRAGLLPPGAKGA